MSSTTQKFASNSNPYAKYKKISTLIPSPSQIIDDKNGRKQESNPYENYKKKFYGKSNNLDSTQRKAFNRGSFDNKRKHNEKYSQEYNTKYSQNTDSTIDGSRHKILIHKDKPHVLLNDYMLNDDEKTHRSLASTKVEEYSPYFPRVQTTSYVIKYTNI